MHMIMLKLRIALGEIWRNYWSLVSQPRSEDDDIDTNAW